jgi:hypothetical protein
VICLGEALIDRLGPLGGDPACDQPVDDRLGGAPANVACGLARLGTAVSFVGRVGVDAIGAQFQLLFVQRDVDISCSSAGPVASNADRAGAAISRWGAPVPGLCRRSRGWVCRSGTSTGCPSLFCPLALSWHDPVGLSSVRSSTVRRSGPSAIARPSPWLWM